MHNSAFLADAAGIYFTPQNIAGTISTMTPKPIEVPPLANPPFGVRKYLAAIGSKGGKKSRRKLSKKEARRIAMVRWAAGAGRGADEARRTNEGKAPNDEICSGTVSGARQHGKGADQP